MQPVVVYTAGMDEILRKAELFINDCLRYDTPRLASEVFPDGVSMIADTAYSDDNDPFHLLDVYYSTPDISGDTAFFLIHGGAFVYGNKELDKNFGMRLAKRSGLPVVNINYTLMPQCGIKGIAEDIDLAMEYVSNRFGFKHFHFTGDSAGGYLAVHTALRCENALSVSPVCGCYTIDRNDFPGALFAAGDEIPPYMYDLKTMADRLKQMKVAVITGDDDFLREDNRHLASLLPDAVFYDAVSTGGRIMTHVFPIGHPDWPEGEHAIDIIASLASGA